MKIYKYVQEGWFGSDNEEDPEFKKILDKYRDVSSETRIEISSNSEYMWGEAIDIFNKEVENIDSRFYFDKDLMKEYYLKSKNSIDNLIKEKVNNFVSSRGKIFKSLDELMESCQEVDEYLNSHPELLKRDVNSWFHMSKRTAESYRNECITAMKSIDLIKKNYKDFIKEFLQYEALMGEKDFDMYAENIEYIVGIMDSSEYMHSIMDY